MRTTQAPCDHVESGMLTPPHVPAAGNDNGGQPLVFRTSFTVAAGSGKPGTATAALMVVVPNPQGAEVHVDFVDPTSYRTLESVQYAVNPPPSPSG